jgi:hypothetical protein
LGDVTDSGTFGLLRKKQINKRLTLEFRGYPLLVLYGSWYLTGCGAGVE